MKNKVCLYVYCIILFLCFNNSFSQEIKIEEDAKSTWWNLPMENPSGTKIAYVKFTEDYTTGDYWYLAEIFVYDINGSNKVKICGISANPHNGVYLHWISDTSFICRPNITVWNISNLNTPYVERVFTGSDLGFTEEVEAVPVDYNDNTKLVLTGQLKYQNEAYPYATVHVVNPFTGYTSKILDASDFSKWDGEMLYSDDPEEWYIWHKYWNPSGTYIWIKLTTATHDPSRNIIEKKDYGFTFKPDADDLDIVFFNRDPESHPTWWDNSTIFHDSGYLFERNGIGSGTQVSGSILHPALSPDRAYIAGETQSTPLNMYLYENGTIVPLALLFSTNFTNLMWGKNVNQSKIHVNPSFSRDGKRIYYTKQINSSKVGLFVYNIPYDNYLTVDGNYMNSVNQYWDDVNTSGHSEFYGWYYSDITKRITNDDHKPNYKKGPWHNTVKNYTLPMTADSTGNVFVANGLDRYNNHAGYGFNEVWPYATHSSSQGWYYSDLTHYKTDGSILNIADGGPIHNPEKGYTLPMAIDNNENLFVANGVLRSSLGWDDVNTSGHSEFYGWYYSDITKRASNGTITNYSKRGPWHNTIKNYSLPMAVDGSGNLYVANGQARYDLEEGWDNVWDTAGGFEPPSFEGWYYSDLTIYWANGEEPTTYLDRGPWHHPEKGYSLPMAVDDSGNVYVANGQARYDLEQGWDNVWDTAGDFEPPSFEGWYYSDLTIYWASGAEPTTYLDRGPWHHPEKGYSLPMAVDDSGNVYVANGKVRYNNNDGFEEVWPSATHHSSKDWYFSDLTVLMKGSSEWYYLNGGPWFNLVKGYSLPLSKSGSTMPSLSKQTSGYQTSIDKEKNTSVYKFQLNKSFPNPFNPKTTIKYQIPRKDHITLTLYNVNGKKLKTLFNGFKDKGEHHFVFDGSNLSSGTYFVRLRSDQNTSTIKLLLIK